MQLKIITIIIGIILATNYASAAYILEEQTPTINYGELTGNNSDNFVWTTRTNAFDTSTSTNAHVTGTGSSGNHILGGYWPQEEYIINYSMKTFCEDNSGLSTQDHYIHTYDGATWNQEYTQQNSKNANYNEVLNKKAEGIRYYCNPSGVVGGGKYVRVYDLRWWGYENGTKLTVRNNATNAAITTYNLTFYEDGIELATATISGKNYVWLNTTQVGSNYSAYIEVEKAESVNYTIQYLGATGSSATGRLENWITYSEPLGIYFTFNERNE